MEKVNFYISAVFVGSFALLMITIVMNIAQLDNPITDVFASSVVDMQD